MTPPPPPDAARYGDPQAVCDWLMRLPLCPFTALQASRQDVTLRLLVETVTADPDQLCSYLQTYLTALEIETTTTVQVYGRLQGETIPHWYREISLPNRTGTRKPSRIERAQAGDSEALSEVFRYLLAPEGIACRVHLSRRVGLLQVILLAEAIPEQRASVDRVSKIVAKLHLSYVKKLRISGQKQGSFFPSWSQDIDLSNNPSFWSVVSRSATETASAITHVGAKVGQTMIASVSSASTTVANAGTQAGQGIVAVGTQASQTVVNTSLTLGQTVGNATTLTTQSLGSVLDWIGGTPYLQHMARSFNVDWLATLIEQVDVVKAEASVRKLQQDHPEDTPAQISHRLMVEKVMISAGTGVVSSLIPGFSLATVALDLATNMALQTEMVYQIAAAYGLDLSDPARKGEVLAIFGISLGGVKALQVGSSYASRAGLTFLKTVPLAGSVIAASTNAALLYALGYGACRYYEARLDPQMSPITLTAYEAAGEAYLASTLTQEQIMDQILVHVILAGNPGKTPADLLPTLGSAHVSPASLESMATHLDAPTDLGQLLDRLSPDFAVPVLVQCHRIAELDGVITLEEQQILDRIKARGQTLTASMQSYDAVPALTQSEASG